MTKKEILEIIKENAKRKTWKDMSVEFGEEFIDAQDYSGGNFDDAYNSGYKDGETDLSRLILEFLKKEEKI